MKEKVSVNYHRSWKLLLLSVTDKKEQPESHQAANERVHGLVADRAQENLRSPARHAQRRDQQEARSPLEDPRRGRAQALHRRGREAPTAPHDGVSRLQIQATKEDHQASAHPQV